jgi:hypothetical protein
MRCAIDHVGADDPIGPLFDRITKYVATRNPNLKLDWQNSQHDRRGEPR